MPIISERSLEEPAYNRKCLGKESAHRRCLMKRLNGESVEKIFEHSPSAQETFLNLVFAINQGGLG